jgi:type I restriction enzyme S subunit
VVHTFSGGTPPTNNDAYYGGDIPWLRTQEVTFGRIFDTEIKITETGLKNSSAKWVPEKSVIVAMYGNSAGRSAINEIPLTTNQACCNLIIDPDKADYRYVFYALLRSYETLKGLSRGAAQNNLNAAQVKAFTIPAPPVQVQQDIGDILSSYDDLIENNRRRMALLEESARLLYREWFVRLRFPGHEHTRIVDGLPEGWDSGTIADFFDTTSGGTPNRSNPDFYTGDINWVKTQELNDDFIFGTEEKITEDALARSSAKLFPVNTLLVSIYGGTNIGRTGILAEPAATNQACCALFPKDLRAHFIYGALYFREQRDHLIGLAQGAAQTNISQQVVRSLKMRMPNECLMTTFIDSLAPVFEQMKILGSSKRKTPRRP